MGRESGFDVATTKRIKPWLAALITGGLASYLDLRDKLSLDEAATLLEVLLVKNENDHRAHEAAVAASKAQNT